jgi:hypothetical protein
MCSTTSTSKEFRSKWQLLDKCVFHVHSIKQYELWSDVNDEFCGRMRACFGGRSRNPGESFTLRLSQALLIGVCTAAAGKGRATDLMLRV